MTTSNQMSVEALAATYSKTELAEDLFDCRAEIERLERALADATLNAQEAEREMLRQSQIASKLRVADETQARLNAMLEKRDAEQRAAVKTSAALCGYEDHELHFRCRRAPGHEGPHDTAE